jgi:hypothetical protein
LPSLPANLTGIAIVGPEMTQRSSTQMSRPQVLQSAAILHSVQYRTGMMAGCIGFGEMFIDPAFACFLLTAGGSGHTWSMKHPQSIELRSH